MQWLDDETPGVPAEIALAFARTAAQRAPSTDASADLGEALLRAGLRSEAREVLETVGDLADRRPALALALARLRLEAGDAAAALELANVIAAVPGGHLARGLALVRLGRADEAQAAFLAELQQGPDAHEACEALVKLALREGGGARLATACEHLPEPYRRTPVGRGYRALALSLTGGAEAARAALDPFDHVTVSPLATPAGYGDLAAFNATLAAEIARNRHLHTARKEAFAKTERLGAGDEPAIRQLFCACRDAIEAYLAGLEREGALHLLPSPPAAGRLTAQANIVRRAQPHAAHVHKYAIVSGVYYVAVPEGAGGAIVLGALDGLSDGHTPAWPTRRITPAAGDLLLFPPHIFHAVEATQTDEARIAVAFDLVG